MTARARTRFVCSNCGASAPKWGGRCGECEAWNTLVEEVVDPAARKAGSRPVEVTTLDAVQTAACGRLTTGMDEFDRLLGGGIVPASLTLLGGEPGIGKSTLLLQIAGRLADGDRRVLYLAGEESPEQIKLRAERLGVGGERISLAAGTALDQLLATCEQVRPDVVICDSVQAVYDPDLTSAPGSVSQVRAAAAGFQRYCKTRGVAVFLVGHVTKDGGLAGPRTLEHVVDTVLQFDGDRHHDTRLLRALKNRFGSTDEIAVFRMRERGLEPVANPSEFFLVAGATEHTSPGSALVAGVEGSRPLLIEIQALVAPSPYGTPQRVAGGFDGRRLALLLAVLDKKAGLALGARDVFLNIVGGLTLSEPAADLGVIVALASSHADRPVRPGTVVFGEVGLTGEIRPVRQADSRLREAARLGCKRAILASPGPRSGNGRDTDTAGLEIAHAGTVAEAVALALGYER